MAEGGLKAGHLNSKFKLRECAEIVFPCPGEKNYEDQSRSGLKRENKPSEVRG